MTESTVANELSLIQSEHVSALHRQRQTDLILMQYSAKRLQFQRRIGTVHQRDILIKL
jgi:hypothetical protein